MLSGFDIGLGVGALWFLCCVWRPDIRFGPAFVSAADLGVGKIAKSRYMKLSKIQEKSNKKFSLGNSIARNVFFSERKGKNRNVELYKL